VRARHVALWTAAALPALALATDPAIGARVARDFCLACHDAEPGPGAQNPLLPRLTEDRFGTPERAYASIGRLSDLNPVMVLPFQGSEAERRALAAWLAAQARRNRQGWWRTALAAAGVTAALGGAGAWAVRRARRA
jgi:mono/diheme cytochrome c family protein